MCQNGKCGYCNQLKTKKIATFLTLFLIALSPMLFAAEDVKIKILAINPSQTEPLNAPIAHLLPPEIQPADVMDSNGLELRYDKENKSYAVVGTVALNPKEAKTIEIRVRDVWTISEDVLGNARSELENSTSALQGTKYEEGSKILYERLVEKLDRIVEDQAKQVGIRQRIDLYRANVKRLVEIQDGITSISTLTNIAAITAEGERTVKFIITAENPLNKAQEMRVVSYLPRDIKANDVLDSVGFIVMYDRDEETYYLEKNHYFEAQEKKTFEITLRDIWYIPIEELDYLKKQTEKLAEHFSQSSYEGFVKQSTDFVFEALDSIERLQKEVESSVAIEDRIRAFVLNSQRLELVKKRIKELQDLLLEVPLKRQLSEFEKIRQAVKELSKVIDILRLGFTPDLSTTWWIILGIIAFLFVMSAVFYVT